MMKVWGFCKSVYRWKDEIWASIKVMKNKDFTMQTHEKKISQAHIDDLLKLKKRVYKGSIKSTRNMWENETWKLIVIRIVMYLITLRIAVGLFGATEYKLIINQWYFPIPQLQRVTSHYVTLWHMSLLFTGKIDRVQIFHHISTATQCHKLGHTVYPRLCQCQNLSK